MKKTKNYIVAAAVIIALIVFSVQYYKIRGLQSDNQLKAVELSTLKDSVSVYKSKNGDLTYKLTSVEIDRKNLKESLDMMGLNLKELKAKDIEWRKITSVLRAELKAKGSGETDMKPDTFRIVDRDTIYYSRFDDWTNGFLSLSNIEVERQKLKFDHTYRTGIDIITETKRKGTLVSVMLSDTTVVVTTGNSVFVKPKQHFWDKPWVWGVTGLAAGYFINRK